VPGIGAPLVTASGPIADPIAHPHDAERCPPRRPGERLATAIGHRFEEIEAELDALTELRDKPGGTVRITCGDHLLQAVLKTVPNLLPKQLGAGLVTYDLGRQD
jgi:hypothetical protein